MQKAPLPEAQSLPHSQAKYQVVAYCAAADEFEQEDHACSATRGSVVLTSG